MFIRKNILILALAVVTVAIGVTPLVQANDKDSIDNAKIMANLTSMSSLDGVTTKAKAPKIPQPDWYKQQIEAERRAAAAAAAQPQVRRTGAVAVTYSIATRGNTKANLDQFAALAHETLNDSRGWAKLGITFVRVSSGGNFSLILSEASQVPTFSPGCSAEWSCRVGSSVIINELRWDGATPAWNAAGGGIRDYRHMVVNHEVGHWLGHGHINCSAPGSYAPVMLQQSIDLQGCKFNPWPLASELRAPNLGL